MRRRMRIIGLLLAAVLFAAATAGCGISASPQGAASDSEAHAPPAQGDSVGPSSSGQPPGSVPAPAPAAQTGKTAPPEEKGDGRSDASAHPAAPHTAADASASGDARSDESGGSQPASQAAAAPQSGPASAGSPAAADHAVQLSIRGDGKKGTILDAPVKISDGDTVLDVLKKATKENKIQMEFHGAGPTAYVEGIDNLYEFDDGAESGWLFLVNGGVRKSGAGTVKVKKGDRIEWRYTTNLGKDVKGDG